MTGRPFLRYQLLLSFALLLLVSCEKFKGDQTIPAYISIDSIYLQTDYPTQGTDSQHITDAWVYVDGDLIGAFEMPAAFPVLKNGKHTVTVVAGIKKNGIASTRAEYPFYKTITLDNVNLIEDDTTRLGVLKTTYESTTEFLWMEDFDDASMSLDTTHRSLVGIKLTTPGTPETFEGLHSGSVTLDTDHDFFEAVTHEEFIVPYAPVYLEMNFNTENSLTLGVYVYIYNVVYQAPVMTLNPTNGKWKKIYVDLTTTLNSYGSATTFRFYVGTWIDDGLSLSHIYFDNFKIVTRSHY